jgi:hypothetical protein
MTGDFEQLRRFLGPLGDDVAGADQLDELGFGQAI